MMYCNCVLPCNRGKYSRCEQEILDSVLCSPYIINDGNVWTCKTCDSSLKCGAMPAQAVANGLRSLKWLVNICQRCVTCL